MEDADAKEKDETEDKNCTNKKKSRIGIGVCVSSACDLALIRSTLTGAGNIELLGMNNTCSLYFINPQFMTGPQAQVFPWPAGHRDHTAGLPPGPANLSQQGRIAQGPGRPRGRHRFNLAGSDDRPRRPQGRLRRRDPGVRGLRGA